MDFKLLN